MPTVATFSGGFSRAVVKQACTMRFEFDPDKNREVKRKHGASLEEAQEILDQTYIVDGKSDDPA